MLDIDLELAALFKKPNFGAAVERSKIHLPADPSCAKAFPSYITLSTNITGGLFL